MWSYLVEALLSCRQYVYRFFARRWSHIVAERVCNKIKNEENFARLGIASVRRWRITSRTWTYGKLHRLYNVAAFIQSFAFDVSSIRGIWAVCASSMNGRERSALEKKYYSHWEISIYIVRIKSFILCFFFALLEFSYFSWLFLSSKTSHLVVNLN